MRLWFRKTNTSEKGLISSISLVRTVDHKGIHVLTDFKLLAINQLFREASCQRIHSSMWSSLFIVELKRIVSNAAKPSVLLSS